MQHLEAFYKLKTAAIVVAYAAVTSRLCVTACGGRLSSSMGVLASPNYPDNYPHDRTCEWVLSAATNRQFLINVTDISLEQHDNCSYDFLEIRLSLVVEKFRLFHLQTVLHLICCSILQQ